MRHEQDQDSHLQHEAEHVKPGKKLSVNSYLAILFAAAFLLLLMTYFMQQRSSSEELDNQENIAVNAMKSIEELRSDNETLQREVEALQARLAEQEAENQSVQDDLRALQNQFEVQDPQFAALNYLNEIRALYNQRKITAAREVMAAAEAEMARSGNPSMEAVLEQVSLGLTEAAREAYDPLEAYRSLVDWLT